MDGTTLPQHLSPTRLRLSSHRHRHGRERQPTQPRPHRPHRHRETETSIDRPRSRVRVPRLRKTRRLDRRSPHLALDRRRTHRHEQPRPPVRIPPPTHPPQRLGSLHRHRSAPLVRTPGNRRPLPTTQTIPRPSRPPHRIGPSNAHQPRTENTVRGWKRLLNRLIRVDHRGLSAPSATRWGRDQPSLLRSAQLVEDMPASTFATASSIIGTYRSSAHGTVSGLMIDDPVTKD